MQNVIQTVEDTHKRYINLQPENTVVQDLGNVEKITLVYQTSESKDQVVIFHNKLTKVSTIV